MNPSTNDTAGLNRRLPADARRQQLIDTAMHVFSRHGFSGTTTRQIAAAAGVNEAIIFRFFPHKEDLYAAILERKSNATCTDAWVNELQVQSERGDDAAVVRSLVTHMLEHHRRDPEFLRLMLHSALEDHSFARHFRERHFAPLQLFLLEYVATRQREGRFRAGDPHALVRAMLGVPIHHSLVETLVPDTLVSFGSDAIDVYTSFILAGLRTTPTTAPPDPRPSTVQ